MWWEVCWKPWPMPIKVDEEQPQIYTSGATNIFKYPELSDGGKASGLISAFEDKHELMELINDASDEEHGIQVYIGKRDTGGEHERLQRG